MQLFIYLQVKPIDKILFTHPLRSELRKSIPALVIFEADQASDQHQLAIGKDLIKEAKKVVIWIEGEKEIKIGALAGLFETLRKKEQPILTLFEGEHPVLEKMLGLLNTEIHQKGDLELIKSFLKTD